ncbi:NAD(P)-binding protein [Duganella sp. FT92W]|uniref:NAD(P)-binding protein n=1 Tax=Pseudoduganella rivuli TaxID=2666085 RepID=A0A7X2LS62_9BURK|nr:NAD(P)/FAD-dependent oxidoreductase [Pseudoduganella rivuli]MRV70469.1 NAD(P)-binding protein [Pseudoduganella rivuli]
MAQPRVIIIGAGPAGVRCAETLVAAGLRPTVVDENRRDGGQIYRRQPGNFTRPYAKLYGTEAASAQALHESFDALRATVDYLPETLAWNIADGKLHVMHNQRTRSLPYDALVICSGATDRLMPVKGWHLAGTYSLGASQIALKAQACAIGRQIVFMGTGPLLYLVASQYVKAGAQVAAVLDTSPFMRRVAALPKLLARPNVLLNGFALVANLKRAGVQVLTGITPMEIKGSPETGVQGVLIHDSRGNERAFECDAVAMGYHLRPETQLADLARCAFRFDHETRQWLPDTGEDGRTSVPGVYLAGDGMKVLGADGAEIGGRLAALALLNDFKLPVSDDEIFALRAQQAAMERFRRGLVQAFPWPAQQAAQLPDDAIVCRCEAITAGELRRVVCDMGAREANRAKALCRVGMGRCQGRYCGHAGAEVIAHAAGVPVEQVGRLRGQAPVRPLPIAVLEEEQ